VCFGCVCGLCVLCVCGVCVVCGCVCGVNGVCLLCLCVCVFFGVCRLFMTSPATCKLKCNYYDVLLHVTADSVMILFAFCP
jgi:hypothetical protein